MQALTQQEQRGARQATAPLVADEQTRTDAQDVLYQQSMVTYVNQQDNLYQSSMVTYVNGQDTVYQNAMINYVATQVNPKADKTYVDNQDTNYYNSAVAVANGKLAKGGDTMNGNINFAAANQGPNLRAPNDSTWRIRVNSDGSLATIAT